MTSYVFTAESFLAVAIFSAASNFLYLQLATDKEMTDKLVWSFDKEVAVIDFFKGRYQFRYNL